MPGINNMRNEKKRMKSRRSQTGGRLLVVDALAAICMQDSSE